MLLPTLQLVFQCRVGSLLALVYAFCLMMALQCIQGCVFFMSTFPICIEAILIYKSNRFLHTSALQAWSRVGITSTYIHHVFRYIRAYISPMDSSNFSHYYPYPLDTTSCFSHYTCNTFPRVEQMLKHQKLHSRAIASKYFYVYMIGKLIGKYKEVNTHSNQQGESNSNL